MLNYFSSGEMKEQTYGWYPSAKNVYEDRRIDTLTPYRKTSLLNMQWLSNVYNI